MDSSLIKKTGTTIVAIKAKNGVVIASDKQASLGHIVGSDSTQKIYKITDYILLGGAGLGADAQFLAKFLSANLKLLELKRNKPVTVTEAANLLSNILYSQKYFPFYVGLILAGKDNKEYTIYNLDALGSIEKVNTFFAEGSGMTFALGVLETNYKKDISLKEAKELAKKAIEAAIKRDVYSGGGIEIYSVSAKGVSKEFYKIEFNSSKH